MIYSGPSHSSRPLRAIYGNTKGAVLPMALMAIAMLAVLGTMAITTTMQGFSTRQVAEVLHLSVKTVETYRANVMKKLCLENARALLYYATQWMSRMGTC